MSRDSIIPCRLLDATRQTIEMYAEDLQQNAASIGSHGLTEEEFWDSGIFRSAIEKIRGTYAATTSQKRAFVARVLDYLQAEQQIEGWLFKGGGERHDYEVRMVNGRLCAIETKGCLDGNNTNIFQRPANADEFYIWSLCQNPGSNPVKNAWSGIHTRLSAEIIHKRQLVDGVIIWDMLCGTAGRPCPKLAVEPERAVRLGSKAAPPPCLYLFPRTIPDPRNNPAPSVNELHDLHFMTRLYESFHCTPSDVTAVKIECRMQESTTERKTVYRRAGQVIAESKWTPIRRAR